MNIYHRSALADKAIERYNERMELLSEHTLIDFEADLMWFEIVDALDNAYKAGEKDMYSHIKNI